MNTEEECLRYIMNNLKCAMEDLHTARSWMDKADDGYGASSGYTHLVSQVENLYGIYYSRYCAAVTERVMGDAEKHDEELQ